jgi:hypothetical protein
MEEVSQKAIALATPHLRCNHARITAMRDAIRLLNPFRFIDRFQYWAFTPAAEPPLTWKIIIGVSIIAVGLLILAAVVLVLSDTTCSIDNPCI